MEFWSDERITWECIDAMTGRNRYDETAHITRISRIDGGSNYADEGAFRVRSEGDHSDTTWLVVRLSGFPHREHRYGVVAVQE